jgi:hypothetical protein
VTWQTGTAWTKASKLDIVGGFTAAKRQPAEANARCRKLHGVDVLDAELARRDEIHVEIDAIYAAGEDVNRAAVPFGDALRAVLAGPHAVGHPPKQSH